MSCMPHLIWSGGCQRRGVTGVTVSTATPAAGRTSAAHVLRCVLGTGLRFAVWASVVNLAYSVRPRCAAAAARMPSVPRLP